jgi:putative nucleotidyltransferase with HDIG domain
MTQNTILIVDDDKENILKTLEKLLENEGYKIFFADNGLKGLDIIKREDIHLVISDYKMPNMDGTKFLQEVKQLLPNTIRILLTGYADLEVARKAINEGEVYRLITKPWNNTELLNTIKQGVKYYNLQKELERLNKLIQLQNIELKGWNFKLEQKLAEQTQQIRNLFLDAIKSLVFALEAKDKYTEGHSRRVAEYATYICEKMSLQNEYIEDIKLAGLLHDIGKIGVKESILDKQGKLTGDEYEHIKTHVVICERILAPIIKKESVIQIVTYHHEHVDGSGYPDGLKGAAIPLGARIVAVADAYDALLSERPYRKALNKEGACAELLKFSGIYFDPEIVKILVAEGCNSGQ